MAITDEKEKIRIMLIQDPTDATILTDDFIDLYLEFASELQKSTDTIALRYYAAFLIADQWQSLGFVNTIEGTRLTPPNANKFLDNYDKRLKNITTNSSSLMGIAKTSLDKTHEYDNDTGLLVGR